MLYTTKTHSCSDNQSAVQSTIEQILKQATATGVKSMASLEYAKEDILEAVNRFERDVTSQIGVISTSHDASDQTLKSIEQSLGHLIDTVGQFQATCNRALTSLAILESLDYPESEIGSMMSRKHT